MDTAILDFSDLIAPTYNYQLKDDLDSINNDSFQWKDVSDDVLESILASTSLDFLSPELLDENIDNSNHELEMAKEDFNKVLEEWKLHLGEPPPPPQPMTNFGIEESVPLMGPFSSGLFNGTADTNKRDVKVDVSTEIGWPMTGNEVTMPDVLPPALEAPDLTSLLEQFEASEATSSLPDELLHIEDTVVPTRPKRACKSRTSSATSSCATPNAATPSLTSAQQANFQSDRENKNCKSSTNGVVTKHKLPVTQLPRFSIILKRDPHVLSQLQSSELESALRDHDYCSSAPQPPPPSVASSPKTTVSEPPKQVSLLKPVCIPKRTVPPQLPAPPVPTTSSPPESLYSKLPDYYTSIVPQVIVKKVNLEDVVSGKSQEGGGESMDSDKESVYNKLPSYLTTIAPTACLDAIMPNQSCTKKNEVEAKMEARKRKAKTFVESLKKSPCDKMENFKRKGASTDYRSIEYRTLQKKSDSPSPVVMTSTPIKSDANQSQYRAQQWDRNRRPRPKDRWHTSSCSPPHSVSSRSRSSSRSSSASSCTSSTGSSASSYVSRSRSRSSNRRSGLRPDSRQRHRYDRSRSLSRGSWKQDDEKHQTEEQKKQIEDRRVVHVGNVKVGTSKMDLRRRFQIFGPIEDITLHYRDHDSDCFGFITFTYTCDAFEALEHGNDSSDWPKVELSLGGRRLFCLENYTDLDSLNNRRRPAMSTMRKEDAFNFDDLLKAAKDKIRSKPS